MSNTEGVLLKAEELLTLREHQTSPLVFFFVGSVLLILLVFYVVLLCVFTLLVPCCDVGYDFRIKTMFGSSLPLVVCRRAHVLLCFVCMFVGELMSYCVLCVCM